MWEYLGPPITGWKEIVGGAAALAVGTPQSITDLPAHVASGVYVLQSNGTIQELIDIINPLLGLLVYGADDSRQMRTVFATDNLGHRAGALAWLTGDFIGSGKTQIAQPWHNTGRLGLIIYGADDGGQMRTVFATDNMGPGSGARWPG